MARVARPEEIAEMRRRLMRAAYAAIAERGFGAVTLQDVAARAGVSKALVLYYFKDKEQLLAAVMERNDAIIRGRAEQAIQEHTDDGPRAELEAYLGALTLGAREHRDFYRVYLDFLSAGLHNAAVRTGTQSFILGCSILEQRVIRRGIASGVFRHDLDPHEASTVVRALIDGLSVQWLLGDEEPFERFCQRLHAAIFAYLGA
jgi:TetR/AcrR family transcriptional regulator, fatty acid metabolism regulator protein